MRIAYSSREYPPEKVTGGIGTYSQAMATAMAKRGHDVHVVSWSPSRPRRYVEDGVTVHRLEARGAKWLHRVVGFPGYYAHFSWIVNRLLTELNPDIVEAPEFEGTALVYALFGQAPVVTRLHSPLFAIAEASGSKLGSRGRALSSLEGSQTRLSAIVSSPSQIMASVVARKWRWLKHCVVVPNCVDLDRQAALMETVRAVRPYDFEYVAHVGRLESGKGVLILADALRGVLRDYPRLHAVFAGPDTCWEGSPVSQLILERTGPARDRVVFAGTVDALPRARIYYHSRFVVLPSLWESFGYVALEAMSFAKTVVATSQTGFEEIITPNRDGILVPPGDSAALETAIRSCLESDLHVLESAARRRSLRFDSKTVAKETERIYEMALGLRG